MTNDEGMTKPKTHSDVSVRHFGIAEFGFVSAFGIRASAFVS